MRILVLLLVAFSFLGTGCSSKEKKVSKKPKKAQKVAVAGQLPDHDFKIHQPLETEIMIMIDSRGKAKQIPDEWSVDISAHKPFKSNTKVASKKKYKKKKRIAKKKKKKNRSPASKKKKKRKKKKKK